MKHSLVGYMGPKSQFQNVLVGGSITNDPNRAKPEGLWYDLEPYHIPEKHLTNPEQHGKVDADPKCGNRLLELLKHRFKLYKDKENHRDDPYLYNMHKKSFEMFSVDIEGQNVCKVEPMYSDPQWQLPGESDEDTLKRFGDGRKEQVMKYCKQEGYQVSQCEQMIQQMPNHFVFNHDAFFCNNTCNTETRKVQA